MWEQRKTVFHNDVYSIPIVFMSFTIIEFYIYICILYNTGNELSTEYFRMGTFKID